MKRAIVVLVAGGWLILAQDPHGKEDLRQNRLELAIHAYNCGFLTIPSTKYLPSWKEARLANNCEAVERFITRGIYGKGKADNVR